MRSFLPMDSLASLARAMISLTRITRKPGPPHADLDCIRCHLALLTKQCPMSFGVECGCGSTLGLAYAFRTGQKEYEHFCSYIMRNGNHHNPGYVRYYKAGSQGCRGRETR
jgi:hypothetical protein